LDRVLFRKILRSGVNKLHRSVELDLVLWAFGGGVDGEARHGEGAGLGWILSEVILLQEIYMYRLRL